MPYSTFIEVFEALGDAIRAKESSSLPIPLYEMPDRIKALRREFDLDGYVGNTWLAKAARLVDITGMTDMSYMFSGCNAFSIATSIDLSGWDTSSVTNMHGMFDLRGSPKIWVPSSFVSTSVTNNADKPFNYASNLTSADVYTDATDAETQGWGTINSKYTMHYNSTYQDFLNA